MFGAVVAAGSKVLSPVADFASQWARTLVLATLEKGITVGQIVIEDRVTPELFKFGKPGGISATMVVLDEGMWWRVFTRSSLGFSESYMLGEVDCNDMYDFLKIMIINRDNTDDMSSILASYLLHAASWFQASNDVATGLQNVKAHYDLSNDLFAAFLSPDMTYSCGLWLQPQRGRRRSYRYLLDAAVDENKDDGDSLEAAQMRKIRDIIQLANIQETDHVLEIGGGWASFAIEAVRLTGCRVTALTLSQEQKKEAESRIAAAGFEDKISFILKDYREFQESTGGSTFDKLVSIEMLEHVGKEHLPAYFNVVNKLLKKEGGIAVVQSSTVSETRYEAYSKSDVTFINQYIFPGAHLPSMTELIRAANQGSNGTLIPDRFTNIGEHYGRTLQTWRENFLAKFDSHVVPALRSRNRSITDRDIAIFRRKWVFYFTYCEAGFRTNMLGNCKIRFVREVLE